MNNLLRYHCLVVSHLLWLLQGITGIRFSRGDKCYIKTQVKARLPDVESLDKESMTFQLVGSSHLTLKCSAPCPTKKCRLAEILMDFS